MVLFSGQIVEGEVSAIDTGSSPTVRIDIPSMNMFTGISLDDPTEFEILKALNNSSEAPWNRYKIGQEVTIPRSGGRTSLAKVSTFYPGGMMLVRWEENGQGMNKIIATAKIDSLAAENGGGEGDLPTSGVEPPPNVEENISDSHLPDGVDAEVEVVSPERGTTEDDKSAKEGWVRSQQEAQGLRDKYYTFREGDMEMVQYEAIREKYLREELANRGVEIPSHILNTLLEVDWSKDGGRGIKTLDEYVYLKPDGNTLAGGVSSVTSGNIRYMAKERTEHPEQYSQKWTQYNELVNAMTVAEKRAEEEVSKYERGQSAQTTTDAEQQPEQPSNESSPQVTVSIEQQEINKGSLEGGIFIVPSGEHWVVEKVKGGVMRVEAGAKVTVRGNVEDAAIEVDGELTIEGDLIDSPVRKNPNSSFVLKGTSVGSIVANR